MPSQEHSHVRQERTGAPAHGPAEDRDEQMQQPHAPLLETAAGRPSTPPLMNLPALQRVVGNQAVQRMLLRSGPAVIQRRT